MINAGARADVVSAVPTLQTLARRADCLRRAVSGEYSRLCLYFIHRCAHRAVDAQNELSKTAAVTDAVRERTRRVVKATRWAAHNVLFQCGARLSAPFIDRQLVGTHVEVKGDEFLRMRRGAYVTLESRPMPPNISSGSDSSVESLFSATTNTVMLAEGRVDQPVASCTRAGLAFGIEP